MGLVLALLFLAPPAVAFHRHHTRRWLILFLTLLLGWSGIAWISLLAWACLGAKSIPDGPWSRTSQKSASFGSAGEPSPPPRAPAYERRHSEQGTSADTRQPFIWDFPSPAEVKGQLGELAVGSALSWNGYDQIHDLYLPVPGGMTQIDHVALVGGALVVIETKNYAGWIFGQPHQREWTVSLAGGRRRYRFQNPLRQNHGHVEAVRSQVPTSTVVLGLVVFAGNSTFPKGAPHGVIGIHDLSRELKTIASIHHDRATSQAAWDGLKRIASGIDRRAARERHRQTLASRSSYD